MGFCATAGLALGHRLFHSETLETGLAQNAVGCRPGDKRDSRLFVTPGPYLSGGAAC